MISIKNTHISCVLFKCEILLDKFEKKKTWKLLKKTDTNEFIKIN